MNQESQCRLFSYHYNYNLLHRAYLRVRESILPTEDRIECIIFPLLVIIFVLFISYLAV